MSNYSAIADRDHAADGAKGAAASQRNKRRRRIEQLEQRIASGEASGMAPIKLVEIWRRDDDYIDRVLVAEDLQVRQLREQAELIRQDTKSLVLQQEIELRRLRKLDVQRDELTARVEELTARVGELEQLDGLVSKLSPDVLAKVTSTIREGAANAAA